MRSVLPTIICCLCLATLSAATVWQEADGVLIMEAERGTPMSESTWDLATDYEGYRGAGFIRWEGGDRYRDQDHGVLGYTFRIENPGTYRMSFRAQAKGPDYGMRNDEANDCWVQKTIGSSGYHKFHVGGKSTKDWHFNMRWETGGSHISASYELDAGEHTFIIAARSDKFMIDRIYFVQDTDDYDADLPESASSDDGGGDPTDPVDGDGSVSIGGDLQRWHRVDLAIDALASSEMADPNPFLDYRFDVVFTAPSGTTYRVPGYFATDGAGGDAGSTWLAHLNPSEIGTWQYAISFRSGSDVAVSLDAQAGAPVAPYDGISGSFTVAESDKSGDDFRAPDKGMLTNRGHHYLTYGGSGRPFLYTGPGIPENILGYRGFTNTTIGVGHEFDAHAEDWNSGDPDWGDGDGKRLIGALNYIADQGANGLYMMSNTIGGDGEDVFPHPTAETSKDRYDLLKLRQWDIALQHAQNRGIFLHWHLSEHEQDNREYYGGSATGGSLTTAKKLSLRMHTAVFGHYNGLKWNLAEEVEWVAAERAAQLAYLAAIDPYDHPRTYQVGGAGLPYSTYEDHLNDPNIDAGSFQGGASRTSMFNTVTDWRARSAAADNPWPIAWDEPQKIENDTTDQVDGYPMGRRDKMWPCLMAGGDGFMWYIQKDGGGHGFDQRIEDFTIMQDAFNWSGHIRAFLQPLPLLDMQPSMDLVVSATGEDYCLARPGVVYAIFNDRAGSGMSLDLAGQDGTYTVRWFDPRSGGALQTGSVATVDGGGEVDLGTAPSNSDLDWAVLVQREGVVLHPQRRISVQLPPGAGEATISPAADAVSSDGDRRIFSGCAAAIDHRVVFSGSGDG